MDESTPELILGLYALFIGGGAALLYFGRRWLPQHPREVWVEAVKQVGTPVGEPYESAAGLLTFAAKVDGVRINLDEESGPAGGSYTVLRARAEGSSSMTLRVEGLQGRAVDERAPGLERVGLDAPAFTRRFAVKASEPELARLWLDVDLQERFLGAEAYEISLAGHEVEASRSGLERDVKSLSSTLRAVAALAGRGHRLLEGWCALAQELGGSVRALGESFEPEGLNPMILERAGQRVEVDLILGDGRKGARPLQTALRAAVDESGGVDLVIEREGDRDSRPSLPAVGPELLLLPPGYRARASDPSRLAQLLPPGLCRLLGELSPRALSSVDDHRTVEMLLDGLVLEAGRLRQAIDVVVSLARPTESSPYR